MSSPDANGSSMGSVPLAAMEEQVVDYESFMEVVKKRRSHWHFNPEPVPDDLVKKVIDAARCNAR